MGPSIVDGDFVLVRDTDKCSEAQWRQVSHVYEGRVWYKRNDGLPGFAGAIEELCDKCRILKHIPHATCSLSDVFMYHAPSVSARMYRERLLRRYDRRRWWLYIPRPNENVDKEGCVCPYLHRSRINLKSIQGNPQQRRPSFTWLVTLRTHFDKLVSDELCFHVTYLPNQMLHGVHSCDLASVKVTIEWEINPCNGFVRISYRRNGDVHHRHAHGRIVCNDMLEEHLKHMDMVRQSVHDELDRTFCIDRQLEHFYALFTAHARAASVAIAASCWAAEASHKAAEAFQQVVTITKLASSRKSTMSKTCQPCEEVVSENAGDERDVVSKNDQSCEEMVVPVNAGDEGVEHDDTFLCHV